MARRTEPIRELVVEVLQSIGRPYSEDITDKVCCAIENNSHWQARYQALTNDLRDWVVNNWIGVYCRELTGRKRGQQVRASSSLIKSYSKLVV